MLGSLAPVMASQLMGTWKSGTVNISGGYLAFHRTGGDGPALVLSHGLTDNGLCWSRFAATLASEFDIIMLDARGHGLSSRISGVEPFDPAQDIAEAIEQLGLVAPIVMGHSVGGRATAAYANAHPGGASKVILEDPAFGPIVDPTATKLRQERFAGHVAAFQTMSQAQIIAKGKSATPSWHDDDFPAWATAKTQVDPRAMPTYTKTWQDTVSHIAAPTLLIFGEASHGGMVSPEMAKEAGELNRAIGTVQIKNAGHNIRRENFADYLAAVRAFLVEDQQ